MQEILHGVSSIGISSFLTGLETQQPQMMAMENKKARFAIAVFYDIARLVAALKDFRDIGLMADDLWLAGKDALMQRGSALHGALLMSSDHTVKLLDDVCEISKLPSAAPFCATRGPVLELLQDARWQNQQSCLDSLLSGDTGATLKDHADRGAIMLVAKSNETLQQADTMRILLRYSQHKVFSRECLSH